MSFAPRKLIGMLLATGLLAVTLVLAPATITYAQDATAAAAAAAAATDPLLAGADVKRGKEVFAKVGVCVSCHGWDGDGKGKNPRSEGAAALLRESQLDTAGFIEIISCGIPGTPMPYHDNQAYKDDHCYGMTADMFEPGQEPRKGKSITEKDMVNLVAYIQTSIQGKPPTTYEDCVAYFEASAEKACAFMKK